jgi:CHAD domain-containing protein
MNDAPSDTLIQDVSADDRTGDVARRTLENRLRAVLYYLPLAAEKADETPEYVHQLRVSTRRAGAALRVYEQLMPRRRLRWIKKQLQRIRHSANNARDLDVLIDRLEKKQQPTRGEKRWLKAARADRNEVQKSVVAVHDRLRRDDRVARRIDELLDRVHSRGKETNVVAARRFGDWAIERLRPLVAQFFAAIPADRTDEAALHQFRIRGKELRYALELLGGALPPVLYTTVYPAIEGLQDRLGVLNDLATSRGNLHQQIRKSHGARAELRWRQLLDNEEMLLEQARKDFWELCTPRFLEGLRNEFQTVLEGESLPAKPGTSSQHLPDSSSIFPECQLQAERPATPARNL